ncbi:hypothetical protein BJX76DRAFT_357567 [Aspergillus varians]
MSLLLEHLSLIFRQWLQLVIQQLPSMLQNILLHPLTPKTVLVLLTLAIIRQTNCALTGRSMNNGESVEKWDSDREIVLLTGGSSGIGKQMMLDLTKVGIRVVILDIQKPPFSRPSGTTFYEADITSPASIAQVARKIRAAQGNPTVLINNAGIGNEGTILEKPEAKIRQTFEVNTVSHFLMVREFLQSMIAKNHGHIITIASMASFIGLGEMVDYCCSKASALAFHEGLRQELRLWYKAPKIRTTVVHPLWVCTPMTKHLMNAGSEFKQPMLKPEIVMLRALPNWSQEFAREVGSGDLLRLREWQQRQVTKQ